MARLNESTISVESVESLKRRFVRQNRELARVNSMQSLRIRSLESEVSHLLAENVSLREQTITLGQEIERYDAAKLLYAGVHDIKTRLENKLIELNDLVTGLGALPRQLSKSCNEKVDGEGQRDSAQSSWNLRHNEARSELNFVPEDDWRLPVIPEDRDFQRDEPGSYELDTSVESPGDPLSPQIAADSSIFVEATQDRFCLQSSRDATDDKLSGDSSINEPLFPPTLETRKKRKCNTAWTENHGSIAAEPIQPHRSPREIQNTENKQLVHAEDKNFGATPQNDFKFCRPITSENHGRDESCRGLAFGESFEVKSDSKCGGQPRRKALKPKNANLNLASSDRLGSPTKENPVQIPTLGGNRDQTTQSITPSESIGPEESALADTYNTGDYQDGTQQSPIDTRADLMKDKPKHSSSMTLVSNRISTALSDPPSRPTRRQRAVVSYAEPNLRDKMRRSNNELIAAVGNGQSRRSSNSQDTKTDAGCGVSSSLDSRASPRSLDTNTVGLCSDGLSTCQTNSVSQRKRKLSPCFGYRVASGKYSPSDGPTDSSPIETSPGNERPTERTSITEVRTHTEKPAVEGIVNSSKGLEDVPKAIRNTKKQPRRHSSHQRSYSREPPPQQGRVPSGKESPTASSPSFLARLPPPDDLDELSVPSDTLTGVSENPQNQSARSLGAGTSQIKRTQRASARRRSMML